MTNLEKAVLRTEEALKAGRILRAYNALDREDTTVGPYIEAVDRGFRFAVIGRKSSSEKRTAREAAISFVNRVGTTRANEATRG